MKKKIAIIHDNLLEYGGSERVLEELVQLYPDADFYTFFFNSTDQEVGKRFGSLKWRTSPLQHLQFLAKLRQYFSIFKPLAWWFFSRLDLTEYDIVITSSHSYNSKIVHTRSDAFHLCYLHTPPRFLYGYAHELSRFTKIWPLPFAMNLLRKIDKKAGKSPNVMVVNSQEVAQRVKALYDRSSTVIYPPVQLFTSASAKREKQYYVAHSRLVKQKNIGLIIEACTVHHLPLKVIGDGYLREELQKIAGPSIEFLGFVSDRRLAKVYESAIALLYAAEDEDFGMVPVEAQSAGVPVLAYKSGGLKETVINGKTGYFFSSLTIAAMIATVQKLEKHPLKEKDCIRHAKSFSAENFRLKIRRVMKENLT